MNAIRALLVAFGFLTRFPVPTGEVREKDLGRSLAFFPLVGLALGLILAGSERLLAQKLPASVSAVGIVALLALLTAGLHLDGLGDVVDGLSGSKGDRSRALEIMKDGSVGAHGAVAIVLVLAAKIAAVFELVSRHGDGRLLVAFPLAARWAVAPLIIIFPYLRPEGLGSAFKANAGVLELAIATVLAAGGLAWLGERSFVPALAAAGTALGAGLYVRFRLGGLTGDAYGAAIELAEVAFLVTAVASLG